MKKLINTSALLIVLFFAACTISEKPAQASTDTASHSMTAAVYTCSMDPEVISDKPGACPVCKMDLIVKTAEAGSTDSTVTDSSHTTQQH
jgi:Heavy metal binding domain